MQPLLISHFSLANSLGAGVAATAGALRARRSGLAPCAFENVALETYVGQVAGLDTFSVRPDLPFISDRISLAGNQGARLNVRIVDASGATVLAYGP